MLSLLERLFLIVSTSCGIISQNIYFFICSVAIFSLGVMFEKNFTVDFWLLINQLNIEFSTKSDTNQNYDWNQGCELRFKAGKQCNSSTAVTQKLNFFQSMTKASIFRWLILHTHTRFLNLHLLTQSDKKSHFLPSIEETRVLNECG